MSTSWNMRRSGVGASVDQRGPPCFDGEGLMVKSWSLNPWNEAGQTERHEGGRISMEVSSRGKNLRQMRGGEKSLGKKLQRL